MCLTLPFSCCQFDNLILDETPVERLTIEDKEYLEQFSKLEMISLNICRLSALENFPTLPTLTRVSLSRVRPSHPGSRFPRVNTVSYFAPALCSRWNLLKT